MKKGKILFLYIVFGISWVLVTDYFIGQLNSINWIIHLQSIKGISFVIITGGFIYFTLKKIEQLNNTKEQQQRLSTLINSMVDFVNFKDGDGRWIEANDFGLKLFQLEQVDYRGKTDSELAEYTDFYRDALIYCEKSDEKAWRKAEITRCEETIPLPDGSDKFFDVIKVPLFHEDGRRKGLVVMGRDITERRFAEEQLRKSEKLSIVGELAASVGHEIRNPLTSIKGFLQLLKKEERKNENYYDIMLSEIERINVIVGELLILAKPQKIQFSTCDVREIIYNVVSLLETQANMENITIHFNSDDPIHMECEQNLLKQLFINIIKNAIEASNEKDSVVIELKRHSSNNVTITVEDQGAGMPYSFMKRLGEPFYSSKEKGTGLGLTVSYKIIEQHGGNIKFYSEIQKGTKVEIELPIKNNSPKMPG